MGLFNLIFTLGVNRRPLEQGLQQAGAQVGRFGDNVRRMLSRTIGAAAIALYGKQLVDTAGKLSDLSSRLGVSTTELQKLDFAARQNGATMEDFTTVLQRLAVARKGALSDPDGSEAKAFAQFGIGIEAIKNARLEDLLSQIAAKFNDVGDSQEHMADALELMGRSAGEIFPTLINGFEATKKAAEDAGNVISEQAVKALDEWGDRFANTTQAVKAQAAETAGFFAQMHDNLASLIDAGIATVKAPFVENGFLEARAAWGGAFRRKQEDAGPAFPIRIGDMGGLRGGRAFAREAEWVGPLLPPGWGDPIERFRDQRGSSFSRPSDALVSVGNFLGGDPTSTMRGSIQQIQARLEKIEQHTKRTADNAVIIRK